MKPLAVDLFCGRGGWTRGLLQAGYDVIGVDLEEQPDYPKAARFLQADIRSLDGRQFAGARLAVASPPCPGFSLMNRQVLEGKRPGPLDFELLAHALRVIRESGATYWAVENVRGAVPWFRPILGDPTLKNAPWFVWGNFPAFLVGKEKMPKFGGTMVKRAYDGASVRKWANASKRLRASMASEIPAGLALPLAEACR